MSTVAPPFAAEPEPILRDSDLPAHPLCVTLQTGTAATWEDLHAVITRLRGVVGEIRATDRSAARIAWHIAFHPSSLSCAAETMIALFDLGQLSFAFPPKGRASS